MLFKKGQGNYHVSIVALILSAGLILGFSITSHAADESATWKASVEDALSQPVLVLPEVTPQTSGPIWPGTDADVGPIDGVPREGTSSIDLDTLDESGVDPALQIDATPSGSRSERIGGLVTLSPPIADFLGQGGNNPNDTNGDVGVDHFVQAINSGFQVFDKEGNSLDGPFRLSSLWLPPGETADEACEFDRGDPVVLYDNLADRWLLSQFQPKSDELGGEFTNFVCIAISQTPDPTRAAGYNLYAFDLGEFPDYFKIGAWTDGYYLSANGANVPVWVFDRVNMLNGNPAAAIQLADIPNLPQTSFGLLLPADIDGLTSPPPGTPSYLYRQVDVDANPGFFGPDHIELYSAFVNWADPASSYMTLDIIPLLDFNSSLCGFLSFGCAPQPGTANVLDPINEVGMFRFPYRNYESREVLAGNFAVDVDGNDGHGIRWFVLERTGGGAWGVADQGTYAPQPPDAAAFIHRFMGSIAMDRNGNLALGYTATSSEDIFPSARYTGRTAGDPPGILPATEQTIREGEATVGPALARWGDYYSLVVDPVDDCTFWYTGDFVPNPPTRQSVISSFRFSDCANDLRVSKWASPDPAMAGEQITYTVNVYNAGILDATNVQVTDTLPTGFLYVADSLPGAECADTTEPTIVCNIGDLAAYDSINFTITADIPSNILTDPAGPDTFDNLVAVVADQADSDELNNSFILSTLVNEEADLELEKICKPDGPAIAGEDTGSCEIYVTNHGPSMARNVKVRDEIFSDGSYIISHFEVDTIPWACAQLDGDLECDLHDMDPGQTIIVTVDVTSDEEIDVNDLATVTSDTPDPDTSNNSDEGQINFIVPTADLIVTKQCQPVTPAPAGSTAFCEIFVYNNGPQTAKNVELNDEIASDGAYAITLWGVSGPGAGTCWVGPGPSPWANADVRCDLNEIPSGETKTVSVSFTSNDDVDVNDTATATSDTYDPDPNNNSAAGSVTFYGVADLSIIKTASPGPVAAGTFLEYTLTVGNDGPSTAKNVVVADQVPAGVTMVSATAGTNSCVMGVPDNALQPTVCGLGDLLPGATTSVTIVVFVLPTSRGVLHNDATVSSDYYDNDNGDNQVTEDTLIKVEVDLQLEKIAEPGPHFAGSELKYLLTLTNGGPSTAMDVVLRDMLPAQTSFVEVKVLGGFGACLLEYADPDVLACTLGNLGPNAEFRVIITVLIDPSVPDGTLIGNSAQATSVDGNSNVATVETLIEAQADLWIDKTGGYITQNPGKDIRYTLTVHNDSGCSGDDPQVCGDGGPSDAQVVTVVDQLPATNKKLVVTYVSEDCVYDYDTHTVTCVTPTLAAGDTVFHEIEATPRGRLRAIINIVDVSSVTGDPNTDNNHDEMLLIVGGGGQKGTGE